MIQKAFLMVLIFYLVGLFLFKNYVGNSAWNVPVTGNVFFSQSFPFIECKECKVGVECGCELKTNCEEGIWILLNKESKPLVFPLVENIPPIEINYTPNTTGEVKVISICFVPEPVKFYKVTVKIISPTTTSIPPTTSSTSTTTVSTTTTSIPTTTTTLSPTTTTAKVGKYDIFAKCLTEEGAIMYGAYWCPHCKSQKEMFGDSFKYINYVECDPSGPNSKPELCKQNNIKNYPTWIINETRHVGVQSLQTLSSLTGCSLPQ